MQKFVRLAGAAVQQGQPLDCTRFIFPDFELKFGFQFRAAANFRKAAFLQGAGFSGATFSQYACFDSSTFNQTAAFYDAIFMQDAAFGNAIFMQDAVFDRTIFMQHTLFAGANFAQDARFVGATFTTDTWFTHAIFAGGGVFPLVKAKNHLSFRKCVVKGAWDWEDTTIYPMATLSFNQAEVEGDLILKDLRFPSPEAAIGLDKENRKEWETLEKMMGGLRACPFQETLTVYTARDPDVRIDFRNVQQRSTSSIVMQGVDAPGDPDTGRGRLDLSKVRFAHTDTSRIKLQNVRWNGPRAWGTGKIPRVADEHFIRSLPGRAPSSNVQDGKDDGEVDPREEGVGPIIVVDPYTGLRGSSEAWALAEEALDPIIVADVYKGLRISYESSLHYSEAGAFHAREMEMRRLGKGQGAMNRATSATGVPKWAFLAWGWILRNLLSPLNAYRLTSNYGESYVRAFWSVVAWFLAVAAFERWLRPLWFPQPLGWPHELVNQAIALMPAQVAGDSVTNFVGRLVGVFLIAGFIIALRRHFRR